MTEETPQPSHDEALEQEQLDEVAGGLNLAQLPVWVSAGLINGPNGVQGNLNKINQGRSMRVLPDGRIVQDR